MTMEFELNDEELDELPVDTISINTPSGRRSLFLSRLINYM